MTSVAGVASGNPPLNRRPTDVGSLLIQRPGSIRILLAVFGDSSITPSKWVGLRSHNKSSAAGMQASTCGFGIIALLIRISYPQSPLTVAEGEVQQFLAG